MRGALTICVLAIVAEQETYGYAIGRQLDGAGLGSVKGGTLYPILTRLEQDGLITSRWQAGEGGPGRKYFAATPAGMAALRQLSGDWITFTGRVTALLRTGRRHDEHRS
jgi:PadR family transcriptional regulator, regulatory protein PadR